MASFLLLRRFLQHKVCAGLRYSHSLFLVDADSMHNPIMSTNLSRAEKGGGHLDQTEVPIGFGNLTSRLADVEGRVRKVIRRLSILRDSDRTTRVPPHV